MSLLCFSFIPAKPDFCPRKYQAYFYFRNFIFAFPSAQSILNLQSACLFSFHSQLKHPLLREFPDLTLATSVPLHLPVYSTTWPHLILIVAVYFIAFHNTDLITYLCLFFFLSLWHYNHSSLCPLHCYISSAWHIAGIL